MIRSVLKIQHWLIMSTLFQDIESIEDHRVEANKDYELADIIFLTVSAVLCGAKGWKAIKIFGEAQLGWLREYRDFSKGIPTRHSIGRIISGIKAESLVSSFINFSNIMREKEGKEHISFDGKVVCGSKHGDIYALQLMTAMVVDNGLIIYQKETSTKTNEIPVMQSMLASMDIKNAVITADAMHCQKETAAAIRKGNGDYVLQIKKNQGKLLKEVKAYFHKTERDSAELLKYNSFKDFDIKSKVPHLAILGVVLVFALVQVDPPKVLFAVFFVYSMSGPFSWFKNKKKAYGKLSASKDRANN